MNGRESGRPKLETFEKGRVLLKFKEDVKLKPQEYMEYLEDYIFSMTPKSFKKGRFSTVSTSY